MTPSQRSIAAVIVFILGTIAAAGGTRSGDEALIRRLEADQAAAWNAHDAAAYAKLFTPDGDVVNVMGWWWQGRERIRDKLTMAFAHAFRDSALTITDTDVRFLNDDVAIAHVKWTMTGATAPA